MNWLNAGKIIWVFIIGYLLIKNQTSQKIKIWWNLFKNKKNDFVSKDKQNASSL